MPLSATPKSSRCSAIQTPPRHALLSVGDQRAGHLIAFRLETLNSQRWRSVASLWGIAVNIQIGKLNLPTDPAFFHHQLRQLQCDLFQMETTHSFELFRLPLLHKDPFDRLLIAQARVEHMTPVTRDEQIRADSVPTLR